jgi:mRNA-degrading endonuclease toxin of MazEF toxin-antitoxin module
MVHQGEIHECNFYIPNHGFKVHPVIILSNDSVNEYGDGFICAMITSIEQSDDFTFWLDNKMLQKEMKKKSQVRLHLISGLDESSITKRNLSKITPKYLEQIIDKIFSDILNTE